MYESGAGLSVRRNRRQTAPLTFTIFTPAYNRAKVLPRVYGSLVRQTLQDFEWLVVDNASDDDTPDVVSRWQSSSSFPIRYLRNETNIGFNGSWKRALEAARGELFIYLRSADELTATALERLKWHWDSIPDDRRPGFSAVTGLAVDEHGTVHGTLFPRDVIDSDSLEIRYRFRVEGEKFGFQRTDVLRQVGIPDLAGFTGSIPPSIVWRAIARRYRTRYVNEVFRIYWQDQEFTLSQPREPWTNAPGRLLSAEDTLDHDLSWLTAAPLAIYRDAIAFVTSSFHVGRGVIRQRERLRSPVAVMLWMAAVPVGLAFYLVQSKFPALARRLPSP